MKKIHIILIIIVIVFICINSFKFLQKTASIKGVAYLEINGNKVMPIKNMAVFLIKGGIKYEMESVKEDYNNNVSPIEEEVKILKKADDEKVEMADRDLLTLKRMELLKNKTKAYYELKKRYELKNEDRNKTYRQYLKMREEFVSKRQEYNILFEKLLNENILRTTKTSERGRFGFDNVPKNNYFLYAYEGSLVSSNVWFFEVVLEGDKSIHLSKRNATDLFK